MLSLFISEKYIFVIGKKGADFVRRIKMANLHIVCELINIFPHISYAHASLIKEKLEECTVKENLSKVDLIYNNFKSVASQELVNKTCLLILKKLKAKPICKILFLNPVSWKCL